MNAPQTTFQLHQHILDRNTLACQWIIFNDENEPLKTFSEDKFEQARALWWSWLTAEEQAEWNEYWEDQEAAYEVRMEQVRERRLLACDR